MPCLGHLNLNWFTLPISSQAVSLAMCKPLCPGDSAALQFLTTVASVCGFSPHHPSLTRPEPCIQQVCNKHVVSCLYCVYAGALAQAYPALSLGSRVESSPCRLGG